MPYLYGLIGFPLSHSFSPAYFRKKFAEQHTDAVYDTFPLTSIDQFPGLLTEHPDICGLNVTIPYKEAIIPFLHEIDSVAHSVGAVNCINLKDGIRKGYNTDVAGFEQSLIPILESQHTQALILGTGGSSKAVAYVLKQLGIPFQKVSRTAEDGCITYEQLTADVITQHTLVINTTPLGMYPNLDAAPAIPYHALTTHHLNVPAKRTPEIAKTRP